jgi:hypothetical protein
MAELQQASPIPANIPKGVVIEWGVDDVRNWLSQSMQLPQYLEQFEGNFLLSSPSIPSFVSPVPPFPPPLGRG